MELDADDIVARHGGGHLAAMIGGGGKIAGIRRVEGEAVEEIGLARRDQGMRRRQGDVVPAHVRHPQRIGRLELGDRAGDPAEPGMGAELLARIRQQLHADADAQEGVGLVTHPAVERIDHAGDRGERSHAGGEGADARQDDAIGTRHDRRIGGDVDVDGTGRAQGIFHGAQVARAIVDQGEGHMFAPSWSCRRRLASRKVRARATA